jgi:hypothetical protein
MRPSWQGGMGSHEAHRQGWTLKDPEHETAGERAAVSCGRADTTCRRGRSGMRRSGAPWLRRSVSGSTSVGRSGPRPLSRLCCVARRSPADSHQRVGRKHVPRWREGEVVTPHSQGDPSAVSVSHPPLGGTVRWAMASETLTGRHRVSSQAAGVAPTRGTKSTPGDCGGVGPGANAR